MEPLLDILSDPQTWVALLTLTSLEIVLGIDNVVFISILAGKLPAEQQDRARKLGLSLAMFIRIGLLFSLSWIIGLKEPLFDVFDKEFSGRDLIMLGGGIFLVGKATLELHEKLEGEEPHAAAGAASASFAAIIVQILMLDIVFSLDSVITAAGMAEEIAVMVAAVVIAVGVMFFSARAISEFVNEHPTVKVLALSFLLLIGTSLVAEGWGLHIPKGYIYFAMGFSVMLELLNMRVRARHAPPVELRPTFVKDQPEATS